MPVKVLLFMLLAVVLALCVATDLLKRRILDAVVWPALVAMLGLRAFLEGTGDLDQGLVSGLVGAGSVAALFAVFAALKKGVGWGDVKLTCVVGAALGFPLGLAATLFIALVGALQAVLSLLWHGALSATLAGWIAKWRKGQPSADRHIPYSVAIALGSLWAMWWDRGSVAGG